MNKLGKKLKQGIALLLAALMVVTCVPVDSLVVQAAEVQEDTDGKEQEPAAAVTGEEEDAGDAEDTEDAAAPEGEETAPEDPEETPADPVKGDATVEEGEGTPDAQTTAPQVEEEIVGGTEADVPNQAAAVGNGVELTTELDPGITFEINNLGADNESKLTATDGKENTYTIADSAEYIKFKLTKKKIVIPAVTCTANESQDAMEVEGPDDNGIYTVLFTGSNDSITVNSLKLKVTAQQYGVTVKKVDGDGNAAEDDATVEFSSNNVSSNAYTGEGDIVFSVEPVSGKTIKSVMWGVSQSDASNSPTKADDSNTYTINESALSAAELTTAGIIIVVTLADDSGSVEDSVTVSLDNSITGLAIDPVNGLEGSAPDIKLGKDAQEIQFRLTGTALKTFKAVEVSGVWNDESGTKITAVSPDTDGTYTLSVTNKPSTANTLTLKVEPEKYAVSLDEESAKSVEVKFTGTGITAENGKNFYNGGTENIMFSLTSTDNTKNIGTVTWNTEVEGKKTITPVEGTYTIKAEDIANAGLGRNNIEISVALVNIVSVKVKDETAATISIENVDPSGLDGNAQDGYTIASNAQAISFKLDGDDVTGMKTVEVTATWKDGNGPIAGANQLTADEKDGVYTITLGEQPEAATTLELSVTTTPYTIVEEKGEGVTISYTGGVKEGDNTYTGGNSDITFKVPEVPTGKRVKAVYLKKDISDKEGVSVDLKEDKTTYIIEANTLNALTSEDDIVISVELENIVTVTFVNVESKGTFAYEEGTHQGLTKTNDGPYIIAEKAEEFTFSLTGADPADGSDTPQLNVFASCDDGSEIPAVYNDTDKTYTISVKDMSADVTKLTVKYELSKRRVLLNSDSAKEVDIDFPVIEGETNGATKVEGTTYAEYDGTNDIKFTVAAKEEDTRRITRVSWKKNANAPETPLALDEDDTTGIYTITQQAINDANLEANDSIIICVKLENIVKVTFELEDFNVIVDKTGSGLKELADGRYDIEADIIKFKVAVDSLKNIKHCEFTAVCAEETGTTLTVETGSTNEGYTEYTIDVSGLDEQTAKTLTIKTDSDSIEYYTVSLDSGLEEFVAFTPKGGVDSDEEGDPVVYYYKGGTNDLTFGLTVKPNVPYTIDKVTWKKSAEGTAENVTFTNGVGTIPHGSIELSADTNDEIIISATLKRNPIPVKLEGDKGKVSLKVVEDGNITKTEDGTFLYDVNGDNKNIVLTATEDADMIKRIEYTAGDIKYTIQSGEPEGENTTYTFNINEGVAAFDDVSSITITVVWKEFVDLTIAENELVDEITVTQLNTAKTPDPTTGKYNVEANEDIYLTVKLKADAKYVISGLTGDCRVDETDDTSADGSITFKFQIRTAATVKVVTKVDSNQANSIVFPEGSYSVTVKDGGKEYTYFGNADKREHYTLGTEMTLAFTANPGYVVRSVTKNETESTGGTYTNTDQKVTFTSAEVSKKLKLDVNIKGETKITFNDNSLTESTLQFAAQDGIVKDPTANENVKRYIVQGSVKEIKFTVNAPAYVVPAVNVDGVAVTTTTENPDSSKEQAYEFVLNTETLNSNAVVVLSDTFESGGANFQFDIDSTTMKIESLTVNGKEQEDAPGSYNSYSKNVRKGSTVVVTVKALENCSLTKTIEAESESAATKNENPLSEGQTSVTLTFSNIGLTTGDKPNMAYGKVEGKENLALNKLEHGVDSELVEEGNFSYTVEYGTDKTYLASVRKGESGTATPVDDYKFELTGDSVKSTAVKDSDKVKVTVSPEDQGKTLTLTMFTETSTPSTEENGTPTITKNTIGSYTLRVRGKLASLEIEGAKKDAEGVYNFTQLIGSSKDYLLKLSDSDAKAFAKEALTATAYKADGTTPSTGVEANVKNGILNVTAKSVAETETATIKITNSADGANAAVLATVKVTTASPFTDKTKVTAKALTSDDTTLSLNVTAPKAVPDPADGKLYYEVQLTASGTLTGQGSTVGTAYQYFAKTGASQILNVNAINPAAGLNGEKCDFTVAVTLVQASAVLEYAELNAATRSTKVVLTSPTTDPLAMATRDPWYADKLTVKQKVKTVYTGQQNILIGSISYDKNTSYTGAVAGVIDYQVNDYDDKGELVPTFDGDFECNVTADGSIYMNVRSNADIGKQTLRVYLEMPATDNYTTHFVPYKDLTITVARGITYLEITGSSGKIYKKDKKAATVKLTAVDSNVAANKTKVTWSVGKGEGRGFRPLAPSDALYKMVTVNSKGQVTVNKNYVVSSILSENEFTVRAKAADYAGNTEYAEETLTVTTEPQQLGDIVIYKGNMVIASGATVAELTADQLRWASVGVLRSDVSLDPDNFDSGDLVDSDYYTIVSSNKKAVDIDSDNDIEVKKIANNVKLTATAKDGSGTKKVMTLKKVNYAPLGDLGLKVTVLGQGGKTATLTDQQSFNFSGTTATRIRIDILEKDADGDYGSFGNYNLKKWGISLKGLKEVYSNATKTRKEFVLQKATGSVVLTGDTKTRKWEYKFTNDAFASATIKAPAVKVNSVKILQNGDAGDMDAPLNFTFSGKAQSISAVTDTCKYVLIEADVANERTKDNYNKTYYFNRTVFGSKYSKLVPISSGGFTLTPANNWNNYTYAGFTAGSYKLRLTYGDVNDDNEFAAKSKTATVTIKVTADKNTFKLTSTYTMSEQDNAVISLTGSGKTVKKVVINRLRGGVVNGQRNQFLNYLELTKDDEGKIKIKDTLPEGKTFADFGALAKQERVGYVQYTVYYNDGTVDNSRVTRDIWEKITINTKKDLVAVKSYKAVVTGDVLAGDTKATAEMTIQANKVPVKVIYMQPDASNEFDVKLGTDKTTFTLTPKNASLTAGRKTVKLTIIPEDSLYGGYGKTDETAIATATANIAKGITVSATVNVKAVTTKGKVSIAANALKQQLRLNADGSAYEAEIPYTAKVRASIKEVKAFTGAANKLVALEDLKITVDENGKILKLSIAKDALVAEKADGKLAWDTTYADSKKVKEAISMTVNFTAAGSVAETFRMTLTTPKNPETFDSIVAAVRECKTNGTLYNVVLSATGYNNDNYLSNVQAGIEGVINGIVLKDSGVTPKVEVENYNGGRKEVEVKITLTPTQGEAKVFVVIEKNAFEEADNLWEKISDKLWEIEYYSEYSEDLNGDTILSDLRKEFEITSDKTDLRLVKTEETVTAPTIWRNGTWSATFVLYNSRTGGQKGIYTVEIDIPQLPSPSMNTAGEKITDALDDVYGGNKATNAVTKEEILSVAAKAVAANEALKVDYKKTSDGQDKFVKVDAKTAHKGFVEGTLIVSDDTEHTETVTFSYDILKLSEVEDLLNGAKAMLKTNILAQYSGVLSEEALKSEIEAVANTEVIRGNAGYSFDCTITAFTAPTYNVEGSVECYLTLKEGQDTLGMTSSETLTIEAQAELLKLEDVKADIEETWKSKSYADLERIGENDDMSEHFNGSWSGYVTLSVATRPNPDMDGVDHDIKQFTKTPITWTAKGKISMILTVSKDVAPESEDFESIEVSLERESEMTLFEELKAEVVKRLEAIDSEGLSKTAAENAITKAIRAKELTGKVTSDTTKLEVSEEEGTIKGTIGLTYKDGDEGEGNTQTFDINIELETPEPAPSPDPSTDPLAA